MFSFSSLIGCSSDKLPNIKVSVSFKLSFNQIKPVEFSVVFAVDVDLTKSRADNYSEGLLPSIFNTPIYPPYDKSKSRLFFASFDGQ